MFPGVASAVPLYLILDALHLLDTRSGLVLVYAASGSGMISATLRIPKP